jgi:hypothetical protein
MSVVYGSIPLAAPTPAGELDAKSAIDMGLRLAIKFRPAVVPGKHVFATEPALEEKMFDAEIHVNTHSVNTMNWVHIRYQYASS